MRYYDYMKLTEKLIKKNYIYKGKIVNLRCDDAELPDGKPCKREVVEHSGGVGVLAVDRDDHVYLVRQFRYPYMEEIYEIPAGKKGTDEEPLTCAVRELREETGLTAEKFTSLGHFYPTVGYSNEIIYIYLAQDLKQGSSKTDEDEFVEVERIHIDKVLSMIKKNEIRDAKTIIAVYQYLSSLT